MLPTFKQSKGPNKFMKQNFGSEFQDKSFHFAKTTTTNYFKKCRPTQITFRSKQNKLPQTKIKKLSPLSNTKSFMRETICATDQNTTQPFRQRFNITVSLNRKKEEMAKHMNTTFFQINKSFGRYLDVNKQQQTKMKAQRKKTLSCKNILKELTQVSKFTLPQVTAHQKNLLELSAQTNYQVYHLNNKCIDTMFPYNRYGPSMNTYNNELILYGGYNSNSKKTTQVNFFHKYNFEKSIWTKVEQKNMPLTFIPCFHTIDIYKNNLILVGGSNVSQCSTRKVNPDICVFNFDKKQWLKLRGAISVRCHASTMFGNTLMIHGGIDQKENNSNFMHFINIKESNIQNSILLSTENKHNLYEKGIDMALSHHKIVNTNDIDSSLKNLLKYDGVFCFGGVDQQNHMNSQITFLNCISRQNSLDVRFQSWIKIQCSTNVRPVARKNHSFNIINKKALILLVGGENSEGQVLHDIWTFDLVKLQWRQINIKQGLTSSNLLASQNILSSVNGQSSSVIKEGVSGHGAVFIGSRLYVFGGRKFSLNKQSSGLWCIESDVLSTYNKKFKHSKNNFASIATIKDSNKSISMWNIEF